MKDLQTPGVASVDPVGSQDDDDLATLASEYSADEPASDPKLDDEPVATVDPDDEDVADDEEPADGELAGNEQLELSDEREIPLANGKKISIGEMKKRIEFYEGSKDAKGMRDAYLRRSDDLANEKKVFETERAPLLQTKQTFENMQHAFEADPIAFGIQAFKLGIPDGTVDKGMVDAIEALVAEYAQSGVYNPHALKARAAELQVQRQAQTAQNDQRVQGFERELWALQDKNQRIFSEGDRTQLVNAWQHLAVTKGGRPTLEEAWKLVQSSAPPVVQKPVAKPSPTKVAQLRKNKPATTERAGGAGRNSGYSKNDLDKDLDAIAMR